MISIAMAVFFVFENPHARSSLSYSSSGFYWNLWLM